MNTVTTPDSVAVISDKPGLVDMANNLLNGRLEAFYSDATAMVDELVERGEVVEQQLKSALKGKIMIELNVPALMYRLGFGAAKQDKRLDELSLKVDKLVDAVTKLTEAEKEKAVAKKPAAKSTATRRKTNTAAATKAKPAAKAAAKTATKSVATKPTAKAAKPATRRRTKANPETAPAAKAKPAAPKPEPKDTLAGES